MAVPDWPGTYGYNLFAYPLSTWIAGPWDLFIEHGHRLLGALAGLIVLCLVAAVHWDRRSGGVRLAVWGALLLVVGQGLLGGARVLLDARTLAMIHGCTGPVFFAYAAVLAWQLTQSAGARGSLGNVSPAHLAGLQRLGLVVVVLSYAQLVLGANLRHVQVTASHDQFRVLVVFHVAVGLILWAHLWMLAWRARGSTLFSWTVTLAAIGTCQLALGGGTWLVKYGVPWWSEHWAFTARHLVIRESLLQALVTTAHVAVGSLILAIAAVVAARCWTASRLWGDAMDAPQSNETAGDLQCSRGEPRVEVVG